MLRSPFPDEDKAELKIMPWRMVRSAPDSLFTPAPPPLRRAGCPVPQLLPLC